MIFWIPLVPKAFHKHQNFSALFLRPHSKDVFPKLFSLLSVWYKYVASLSKESYKYCFSLTSNTDVLKGAPKVLCALKQNESDSKVENITINKKVKNMTVLDESLKNLFNTLILILSIIIVVNIVLIILSVKRNFFIY